MTKRWVADPATATRAIGEGLRALQDTLPVALCPFSWSAAERVADVHRRAEAGEIDPDERDEGRRPLDLPAALVLVRDILDVDKLVVCHDDTCAPNTLIDDSGRWSGHVDFGGMGVADRRADVAIATLPMARSSPSTPSTTWTWRATTGAPPGGPSSPARWSHRRDTGKSTYVRKVAEYPGWPLVVLDPSVFAAEGLPLIATVASRVFNQLLELEDTVIFFDEMEALMYTRADSSGSFEQKFLTTSLLPKLQERADRSACLFFVATNHFDTIDPAAHRPGRFDFTLQILPPSCDEKLRLARDTLGDELLEALEVDLRSRPYHEHIRLATRSEMLTLCDQPRNSPHNAEQILSHLKAELPENVASQEQTAGAGLG